MSDTIPAEKFLSRENDGSLSLNLLIEGMHCPSCVAIIEGALKKQQEVLNARLNLSTKRLKITWSGLSELGDKWIELINKMGYRAVPFDPKTSETQEVKEQKFLLRCLAVAGFASGNLMLFSVALWSSDNIQMGEATRTLFHWIQALISIPAIIYCGRPFYISAWKALKQKRTNMDVPISVAVILATLMSVFETITHGKYAYFDSGVMLLFFLLIGRYFEQRAKGRARSAAQDLLKLMAGNATIIGDDGRTRILDMSDIKQGMKLLVAPGEKIAADGEIISGESDVDMSLITGESLPAKVLPGSNVFAGTINISSPIKVSVTKPHEKSLIAEIVKLMEVSEQSQARYVTLADRISGWYTPVVHILAALTFIGWMVFSDRPWQLALLYAATVLIITCPCALGLAVPVVQVLASGKLMRAGIMLKSGSALERLAVIDQAIFDKTGTLTLGKPKLIEREKYCGDILKLAASIAAQSKHPLSKAIAESYAGELLAVEVKEIAGCGLEAVYNGNHYKLGKRSWCTKLDAGTDSALEMWLAEQGKSAIRFTFADQLREDAAQVINCLNAEGIKTALLSGDRQKVAMQIAYDLGISDFKGEMSPVEKSEEVARLKAGGHNVLMVGDGLNDAPSLASATISMSPSSAIDITQNAADIVFQGEKLGAVVTALKTAKFSQILVKENFALSLLYNVIAIPLAVMGHVTPLVAAIAMSSSSLLVIGNAMRLNLKRF